MPLWKRPSRKRRTTRLVAMFPAQTATMDQLLAKDLERILIPGKIRKARGIAVGHQAAAAILAMRANDGSQIPDPTVDVNFFCGDQPGEWRQDPITLSPRRWAPTGEGSSRLSCNRPTNSAFPRRPP